MNGGDSRLYPGLESERQLVAELAAYMARLLYNGATLDDCTDAQKAAWVGAAQEFLTVYDVRPRAPAQGSPEISQHIGWIKLYVEGMTVDNWRDMKLRAERQLEKLSDAVAQRSPVLGDIVRIKEGTKYFHDWRDVEMKLVSLRVDHQGKYWASLADKNPRSRGFGYYDGETTDFELDHLEKASALPSTSREFPTDPNDPKYKTVGIVGEPRDDQPSNTANYGNSPREIQKRALKASSITSTEGK